MTDIEYRTDVASLIREGAIDAQCSNPKQAALLRERHERKVARLSAPDRKIYDDAIAAMAEHNRQRVR